MSRKKFSFSFIVVRIVLAAGMLVCIFPFIWMVIGTTLNPNLVVRGVLIPGSEFLSNWKKANSTYALFAFFFNSLFIAVMTVAGGLIVNACAAFGFEKYRSRTRSRIFGAMLVTMIVPQMAIVIPLFRQFAALRMLDTHLAIILPSVVSVFIIFFFRQNFRMFPTEIMEAARVDGAGEFAIFWKIVAPSMKATFAAALAALSAQSALPMI